MTKRLPIIQKWPRDLTDWFVDWLTDLVHRIFFSLTLWVLTSKGEDRSCEKYKFLAFLEKSKDLSVSGLHIHVPTPAGARLDLPSLHDPLMPRKQITFTFIQVSVQISVHAGGGHMDPFYMLEICRITAFTITHANTCFRKLICIYA